MDEIGAANLDVLLDPRILHLLVQFPLALAVANRAGDIQWLNQRFQERFDPTSLRSPALQRVFQAPDAAWRQIRLAERNGGEVEVSAHAVWIEDRVMLVIDDTVAKGGGDQVAVLHRRVVELERENSTDRLTGAWNRVHLDRVIVAEIARSARFRLPLSIILMDIDHFKKVNDTHGHLAGDVVLKHLVTVIRAKSRSADLLFRWGGEEFVLLASSAGYRAGEKMGEALRRVVQEASFPVVDKLTISVGVAELVATESAEEWFARADAALYSAKTGGRNRVCVDRRGSSDIWAEEHGHSALRLEWKEAYECGDSTIDGEHRGLFDLANVLIDASVDGKHEPAPALEAMDRLIAHVIEHFAHEEALLAERGYAGLKGHQRAHSTLVARATKLRDDMQAGTAGLGEVVEFLAKQVAAGHIFTTDRDFYPLFGE